MEKVTTIIIKTTRIIKRNRGVATKDGVQYEMRELQRRWRLATKTDGVKIEFEWRKKDLPEFSDWCERLSGEGYTIALSD